MTRADYAGQDLTGRDFSGEELSFADFTGATLVGARFDGATLHGASLADAELLGASFVGADLSEVKASGAGFGSADLSGASLISADLSGATLSAGRLQGADLRAAVLTRARLVEADLSDADLSNADLREADLTEATARRARFRSADLREARTRGLRDYDEADWVGVDVRHADFCGAWLLRRHILDENYLAEFRGRSTRHEWMYRLWWLTSDCGRSVSRWAGWTVALCLLYAWLYRFVDLDGAGQGIDTLYFSVVTFTTLGYGDVLPHSVPAKLLVASEVVLGYMALGGVLSIISTKMGSRAGGV